MERHETCDMFREKELESCDGLAPTSHDFIETGCINCPKLFKDALKLLDSGIKANVYEGPPSGPAFYRKGRIK